MKKKELHILRDKTQQELDQLAEKRKAEVAKIRQELLVGRHKNLRVVKSGRRDLAQIRTILREKMIFSF